MLIFFFKFVASLAILPIISCSVFSDDSLRYLNIIPPPVFNYKSGDSLAIDVTFRNIPILCGNPGFTVVHESTEKKYIKRGETTFQFNEKLSSANISLDLDLGESKPVYTLYKGIIQSPDYALCHESSFELTFDIDFSNTCIGQIVNVKRNMTEKCAVAKYIGNMGCSSSIIIKSIVNISKEGGEYQEKIYPDGNKRIVDMSKDGSEYKESIYSDGSRRIENTTRDGDKYKQNYYADGSTRIVNTYKDGSEYKESTYSDGSRRIENTTRDGNKYEENTYADGSRRIVNTYKDGSEYKERTYADGTKRIEKTTRDGDKYKVNTYSDGTRRIENTTKDGKKYKEYTYSDGTRRITNTFKDGNKYKKNSYLDGSKRIEVTSKDGTKDTKTINSDGTIRVSKFLSGHSRSEYGITATGIRSSDESGKKWKRSSNAIHARSSSKVDTNGHGAVFAFMQSSGDRVGTYSSVNLLVLLSATLSLLQKLLF